MDTKNHHIDELFARELGNIEIEPPQSIWQGIEKKLDNKKRIGLLYFRIGLAAGIALLVSVSGVYWYNHTSKKDTVLVASKNNNKELTAPIEQKMQANTANSINNIDKDDTMESVHASYVSKINPKSSLKNTHDQEKIITENIHTTSTYNQPDTSANEQNATPAYIEPRSGIIAMNKPGFELYIIESSSESQTNTQLANNAPEVKINRWSIEAQAAPLYSYRTITSNSELNVDFNNNESGLVSYSNAIKINYQTSKRLTIQFGLTYSIIGQTLTNIYVQQPANNVGLKYSSMNANSRVNTSFGLINNSTGSEPLNLDRTSSMQYTFFNTVGTEKMSAYAGQDAAVTSRSSADIIQRMQILEIPVTARYYIIAGKFNWHVTSGLSTNILVGNDALLRNNNQKEKIGETDNLKRLNYAGIIGTGIGYAIKKNIILTLEPTFKYYLNSISTSGIQVHPYSFGLYTGICYKL